ncbi:MAG: autotransporter assembly complex protein TamA [Pseudomonadota bacterium]|nr:autotransporter assembly complex protein TamA [Pseudomonadota bacterium]
MTQSPFSINRSTLASCRDGRLWRTFLAVAALVCSSPAAAAQDEGEPALRYRIEVSAPSEIKRAVERNLTLTRWQTYPDLTPEFLDLLIAEAKLQARDAVEAAGYFSATVDTEVDRETDPPTVKIRIEPGPPTRVTAVNIDITGPLLADASGTARTIADIRSGWSLPEGAIFQQSAWLTAKAAAVRTVTAERYAAARIVASEAVIDPETRSARLSVTLDSGPPFRFGALVISGLEKYPPDIVHNLTTFTPGESYAAEKLDVFVRRLNGTGYFATAQVAIETDPAHADAAAVSVRLIEAPNKKITTGLGFSTDTLYRAQLTYTDVNLNGNALRFDADLRAEAKIQSAVVRFTLPPRVPAYTDSFPMSVQHTDIEGLRTKDLMLGWRRQSSDPRNQTAYSTAFYYSQQMPIAAEPTQAHALYLEIGRTWRTIDDLLAPTTGQVFNVQLGAGPPGISTRGFGRGIGQFAWWIPLDRATQLQLRAEGGAVLVNSRHDVPSPLLFRTGGDTTVRGYAFESLGPREGDATVGGRYYALTSAEITHWFAPAWGLATFVDAGNAADEPRDLKPVYGYGVGVRVRTPIGPFRVDIAYGQETKQVRLHLSIGLTF